MMLHCLVLVIQSWLKFLTLLARISIDLIWLLFWDALMLILVDWLLLFYSKLQFQMTACVLLHLLQSHREYHNISEKSISQKPYLHLVPFCKHKCSVNSHSALFCYLSCYYEGSILNGPKWEISWQSGLYAFLVVPC